MTKDYIPPSNNECDLNDCFAHSDKSDTCTLLKTNRVIHYDCPFYKPVPMKNGHKVQSNEWFERKVQRETTKYARERQKKLKREVQRLRRELKKKEDAIMEAEKEVCRY